jgi:hypothetical protein
VAAGKLHLRLGLMSCFDYRLLVLTIYNERGFLQQVFKDNRFGFFATQMRVAGQTGR